MSELIRQTMAFVKALESNPTDVATRQIFADFLEENDEPELAEEQRNFSVEKFLAEKRLRAFAEQYASGDYEGMVQGLLEGDYCFSDDDGPHEARFGDALWEDLTLITGEERDSEFKENASFRCAC